MFKIGDLVDWDGGGYREIDGILTPFHPPLRRGRIIKEVGSPLESFMVEWPLRGILYHSKGGTVRNFRLSEIDKFDETGEE